MQLLLFLSAMLSALTGALSGVRVVEAQMHHSAAQSGVAAAVHRGVNVRPVRSWQSLSAWPALATAAAIGVVHGWVLAAGQPIYLSKLRQ